MLKPILRERRVLALFALITTVLAFSAVAAFAATGKTAKVGDDFFNPKTLKIHKGTKVTWHWTGSLSHNVTVKSGPAKFHSKTQARGSYSHTFTRAGTYHLVCTIHPFMKMTIVVN